jgi:hypothetical protein
MTSALIGYTGFVGANLAVTGDFDLHINRTNLEALRGRRLERLVCAGLPAAKWLANQKPREDADNIHRLEAMLNTVWAGTFILISTIDVYPCTADADELYVCTGQPNHAYGEHRLEFEHFVRDRFPNAHIVRLPALFGRGLKKNAVYDLLHDNRLERINPASRFQWYPLVRLAHDLETIQAHRLPLVNLFTEPVETRTILQELFADKLTGASPDAPAQYDLRTRYGCLFGGDSRYVMSSAAVMTALREFVCQEMAPQ